MDSLTKVVTRNCIIFTILSSIGIIIFHKFLENNLLILLWVCIHMVTIILIVFITGKLHIKNKFKTD